MNMMDPQEAAERAVAAIGLGYDLNLDIKLSACKGGPNGVRLIELGEAGMRDLVLPGEIVVPGVSSLIKCDKGERTRFSSDVLSFTQVCCFTLNDLLASDCKAPIFRVGGH